MPQFGEIVEVIISGTDSPFVVTKSLHTVAFNSHFHSYEVTDPVTLHDC